MADLAVTMREVAERAGVSLMTVSRVLRNHTSVAPATRVRVARAAEELGYRTNPLVGAWMAHLRSSTARQTQKQIIAFLTWESAPAVFENSLTVRSYYEGARERAEQLGFELRSFGMDQPRMTGKRMSTVLQARGIVGLLIAPVPSPVDTIAMEWERFSAVCFGYSMQEPNLHRVTNHQIHSIRLAVAELTRLGYRRIGLALELAKDVRVDYNWTSGFLPYQMSLPVADRIASFLPPKMEREGLLEWVSRERPEVIVGGRPDMIEWLRAVGKRVPEDIGFATLEWYQENGDIAGVDQNSRMVGSAGLELVVEQLYHNQRGLMETPKVVLIESRWQPGNSVARLR